MIATITSKGQITIPKALRDRWGLEPGQKIKFDETAPFLTAQKVADLKKAFELLGSKKHVMPGVTAEQWLSKTRGRKVKFDPPHGKRNR